ncbi:hypothetical protein BH09ACT3_BH09ACT3_12800 [soil metagenome]
MAEPRKKKVVKVEATTEEIARAAGVDSDTTWAPTAEAKGKATSRRVIAIILWVVAIGLEAGAIFWLLKQTGEPWFIWVLVAVLVVIAVLSIIGSQLWKAANTLDPAKKSDTVRFFVQNQLGAIIAVIAFLPLIILIFLNKDMDGKQKGIAGGIGVALLVVAAVLGISFAPPSVEENTAELIANEGQIDEYSAIVEELTGGDTVYWTPQGTVYHICDDVPELKQESQDAENNVVNTGTVASAHGKGKAGLTLEVQDELEACALPVPGNIDEIVAQVRELRSTVDEDNAEVDAPAPATTP